MGAPSTLSAARDDEVEFAVKQLQPPLGRLRRLLLAGFGGLFPLVFVDIQPLDAYVRIKIPGAQHEYDEAEYTAYCDSGSLCRHVDLP